MQPTAVVLVVLTVGAVLLYASLSDPVPTSLMASPSFQSSTVVGPAAARHPLGVVWWSAGSMVARASTVAQISTNAAAPSAPSSVDTHKESILKVCFKLLFGQGGAVRGTVTIWERKREGLCVCVCVCVWCVVLSCWCVSVEVSCCCTLRCVVLCCVVLCCAVLCCVVLCCVVLCCAVLCCVVLCCVVLCCVVLCCAVLCCVVLCCVVLCCVVSCCFGVGDPHGRPGARALTVVWGCNQGGGSPRLTRNLGGDPVSAAVAGSQVSRAPPLAGHHGGATRAQVGLHLGGGGFARVSRVSLWPARSGACMVFVCPYPHAPTMAGDGDAQWGYGSPEVREFPRPHGRGG